MSGQGAAATGWAGRARRGGGSGTELVIDVLWLPEELAALGPAGDGGGRVAVIDVLRATSTIVTALAHGARAVVPVQELEEARALADRLAREEGERPLLGGERHAVRPPGFDLGNSPLEYRPEVVGGRTVVLTTTNGTRAFRLCQDSARAGPAAGTAAAPSGPPGAGVAAEVAAAALVNAPAVAAWLAAAPGRRVTIVCAGTEGRASLEDAVCAGWLVAHIEAAWSREGTPELTDGARAARHLYQAYAGDLAGALRASRHGARLAERGFEADLSFCARVGVYEIVPVLQDGRLVAAAAARGR